MAILRYNDGKIANGPTVTAPFGLAVNMGLVQGFSTVDKFGENPDIDTGTGPEDVWEFGGVYTYDADGTAPIQYVSGSSSADAGFLITVIGLDIDGNEVEQTITMADQANVTLATPLWRVYRMYNSTPGGTVITGIIYCHTDPAPTAGVPAAVAVRATIHNGNNQTLMALYTIPRGKVGYLFRGELGGSRANTSGAIQCSYYSRRYGGSFNIKKRLALVNSGSSTYQDERSFPDVIPDMTDIRMRVEEVSANNVGVFGTLDILLVDEECFSESFLKAIGQMNYR